MQEWNLKSIMDEQSDVKKKKISLTDSKEWNLRTVVNDIQSEISKKKEEPAPSVEESKGLVPTIGNILSNTIPQIPAANLLTSAASKLALKATEGILGESNRLDRIKEQIAPLQDTLQEEGIQGARNTIKTGAWTVPIAANAIGGPAAMAGTAAVLIPAVEAVDRYIFKDKETNKKEGIDRALSGAGSWIDPRAESEMPEHAIVARDSLDALTYFGSPIRQINHYGRKFFPVIKAGLQESAIVKKPVGWVTNYISTPLMDAKNKAVAARIFPTWEKVMRHGTQEKDFVKKSLEEIFQPAVERLSRPQQSVFRNTQVLRKHLNIWGQDIGNVIAKETDPLVRLEIAKGIRGTSISELTTERAKEVVSTFSNKLNQLDMKPRYANAFKEQIGKSIGERLSAPEEIFTGTEFQSVLSPIIAKAGKVKLTALMEKFIPKEINIKGFKFKPQESKLKQMRLDEVQKGLRELISDPTIPYEYQIAAKDLHNLAATLPEEVAAASKSLTEKMLSETIKRMHGVVIDKEPLRLVHELKQSLKEEGLSLTEKAKIIKKIKTIEQNEYMPSMWRDFISGGKESLYVQRDVELELRALSSIPKMANGTFNKYFMSPWKISKVMLRPAAWMRNGVTNAMQNHLGGLPMWDVKTYKQAISGMRGSAESVAGNSLSKHWKDWNKYTGGGGTFTMTDVVNLGKGYGTGSSMWERGLARFDKIISPGINIYNAEEQMFKFAKYLHNVKKGISPKEAVWDAMQWTFNYGEVTRATAAIRTYAAPFFTWQSKIFPQVLNAIIKNPVKATGMFMLYKGLQDAAINEAGFTNEEWEEFNKVMPQYLKDGMMFPLPWRDEQDRLQLLDLTYIIPGFGDAFQMSAHPMAAVFQHPLVGIAGGLQHNKKFSGAPIYYDWESNLTKALKSTSYVWEQLVPAPMIGGTDWNKMWNSFIKVPMSEFEPTVRDLSRMQAMSSSLGGKITVLDIPVTYQQYESLQKIKKSEIRIDLKRKLRNARSEKEIQELIDKYGQYLLDLEDEGEEDEEEM